MLQLQQGVNALESQLNSFAVIGVWSGMAGWELEAHWGNWGSPPSGWEPATSLGTNPSMPAWLTVHSWPTTEGTAAQRRWALACQVQQCHQEHWPLGKFHQVSSWTVPRTMFPIMGGHLVSEV